MLKVGCELIVKSFATYLCTFAHYSLFYPYPTVATVYDNAGAEYGSIGKEKLLAAEAKAK